MKKVTVPIKDNVKEVLSNSTIASNTLILPPTQLDRNLYVDVNKILELLGGKWNRKLKCHVFDEITKEQLSAVLNGDEELVDVKKTYQEFFTPAGLAARVVELADVSGQMVLEPSAGIGNLADECAVQDAAEVDCVEIQKEHCNKLSEKGYNVRNTDFLTIEGEEKYDRILMNPPFTRNQDCKHVEHALKFLKPGGKLVAIMANNQSRKPFIKLIEDREYEIEEVAAGEFSESGTQVRTLILSIWKK
ncbi:MAG: methyltransferase [Sulfurimonas sp.]